MEIELLLSGFFRAWSREASATRSAVEVLAHAESYELRWLSIRLTSKGHSIPGALRVAC